MMRLIALCTFAITFGICPTVLAHAPDRVLVVVNGANADSVRIGTYYAKKRMIPADQVLRLTTLPADPADVITRQVYEQAIGRPIARWLAANSAQDRITFIVLTKGIPLAIQGSAGAKGTRASVDSELSVLYLRMTGANVPLEGGIPNPYFLGDHALNEARPFSHEQWPLFLVSRLDGFTVDEVIALIERAVQPTAGGKVVLDGRLASPRDVTNGWLRRAAERLNELPEKRVQIMLDDTTAMLSDLSDVLGYFSIGSNDPARYGRRTNLRFAPGAIAAMPVSTGARTFREPPSDWSPGTVSSAARPFAGSPQSLVADLIRDGVTAVAGDVTEPLLGNTVRPYILFPAYVSGFTAVESYYLALPMLSWTAVVVGDPLCAPFARSQDSPAVAPPLDPETELPAWFSRYTLKMMQAAGTPEAAARAAARADAKLAHDDVDGAITALEDAIAADASKIPPRLKLAELYEQRERYDRAVVQYRWVLSHQPDNAVALNNLAYALAVREHALEEALPLAERARAQAPNNPGILDTLGWIYHLTGDQPRAAFALIDAARLAPDNADIGFHLVEVLIAAGRPGDARTELARVLKRHPELAGQDNVIALQKKLP